MGSSISMQRFGPFLQVISEDENLMRLVRDNDGSANLVPCKRLFIGLADITSVTLRCNSGVNMTLKNGMEYLLDDLEDADETFEAICRSIYDDA